MKNKISIAIPSYNRKKLVDNLVSTIPDEVFVAVSDNGGYLKNGLESRVKNLKIDSHKEILDVFDNWNHALNMVLDHCDYVAMPSDDDLYLPGWFSVVKKYIECNEWGADIFVFGHKYIDGHDNYIGEYSHSELIVVDSPFGFLKYRYGVDARMPSVVFRSEFLKEIGSYDASLFKLTAADSELIQRALLIGKVVFAPEVISCYRVWDGSLTNNKVASTQWLKEIDMWTQKISKIGFEKTEFFTKKFSDNYSDEIYARNLYAGLSNLFKRREYKEVLKFKKSTRWPSHALAKTKLRILLLLLKAKLKSYAS